MTLTPEIRKRFDFDWQVMDVVIGGKSAIDSAKGLKLRTPEEIKRFLECYGYDLDNPIEQAELFGNFQEAMSFIRRYFLKPENPEGLDLEIPRKILEITDINQLFLMAGEYNPSGDVHFGHTAYWACSIIKIMHTIAHMDKDFGANYFADIQKQILDRFYKYIYNDPEEGLFLGKDSKDSEKISLVIFDSKPKKSRDSVILKLLHKPENVAEELFDRIGIRFVTKTKLEAIRVVKFLRDRNVIMPGNIKPSRSRNTLFDADIFLKGADRIMQKAEAGKINANELDSEFNELLNTEAAVKNDRDNPHSSKHYQSMQFTGRQLIKLKNPLYDELKNLKSAIKGKTVPEEILKITEGLDLKNIQRETRFFYPFEVQVTDEISHSENVKGKSSHGNYKKSQVKAAMTRVMASFLLDK